MMQDRFVLAAHIPGDHLARVRSKIAALGLETITDEPGILLAVGAQSRIIDLGETGTVIGALYAPGIQHRIETIDAGAAVTIRSSRGQRLVEAFWGDYVALVRTGEQIALVRSPFGRLPCYLCRMECGLIAASNLDDLMALAGKAPALDFTGVARQLIAGSMRHSWTCLEGIEELRGGDLICVNQEAVHGDHVWSPWKFVAGDRTIFDREDGARRLRHTAMTCAARRADEFEKPLLMLSGGLDSSVTAACLAATPRPFACLNLATCHDAAGNESHYARQVTDHFGMELAEQTMGEDPGDIRTFAQNRLPRPAARGFEQLLFRQAARHAGEIGCDGIIDGGAGDNVFGALMSASPAADCLLDPAGAREFTRVCADIASIAEAPRWKVRWKARRRAYSATRPFRWPIDTLFLSKDTRGLTGDAARHPWIDAHSVALPGRAAHIAMIAAAQCVAEDGPYGARTNAVSPLLAQPLVELCLAIPSWHWFEKGCNRAAARRAFEDQLPREVAWRRSKGAPDSAAIAMFTDNRHVIRDQLASGLLAASGIIDMAAVLKTIDDPRPVTGTNYNRILQIFDAECWARGMLDRP